MRAAVWGGEGRAQGSKLRAPRAGPSGSGTAPPLLPLPLPPPPVAAYLVKIHGSAVRARLVRQAVQVGKAQGGDGGLAQSMGVLPREGRGQRRA